MKFTYRELKKCAEREVALRKRVYAKRGKSSPKDQAEIEMMEEIAQLLAQWGFIDEEVRGAAQPPLHP